ncbi:tRNA (adenosine(37)-N6)-threonylcarbamoyltransferase complex transferase subunit TsaD [Chlamydia caviae]|uniref:tRNA N6-adenosine threonylcarbamoyltransferase n=1 Tax=Chlamydia caviae (strain ATCC VR-813 / DSM 19441 / 03DC25 / GPIC) TaxID=227941 RepID=TSAD_CHLCV|nr:tRNA (adenosine(37)-N6)-threonylcarbamoyltransferase complex transferase subunit TsaD [Chlamydia caviae]Q822Y4.1 RecName: Full=tRNA N6-adenosine threonylcarbamoyltransferase; AltName: Full=N6-L-threonylcarbamoyladenine synthase; Short=t(6)A synthase; AltName: Full=t(6)A37 threonylcarbamoyladenosine biosynthesis protein TsaD; AltName: Full=tRNA threonylcarbamoyladenosine biosynthesis protein TsaD [Chlamydia caviae GPIC]AAP05285.1 O-sialoglycoprotein endopeptidase [Chlamydia caviae GPIC]
MLTLGLESSCDETACALVDAKGHIMANVVFSQQDHVAYGGIVPELASRAHLRVFPSVVDSALKESGVSLEDIDLIAVTHTPGLIGSLAIGVNFAKGLAIGCQKPIIGVNHVEAHLYAAYMEAENVEFPALGLAVSGAHTAMFLMEDPLTYKLIGKSRDDAIGETFDKVARFLGLPYPGGSLIEKLASCGCEESYSFSPSKVPGCDLSFSGLKTAVLYAIKGNNSNSRTPLPELSEAEKSDIAASFQRAAFTSIAQKLPNIVKKISCRSILVGGGVASNKYFQNLLKNTLNLPLYFPSSKLCTDNAAMIAGLGRELFLSDKSTIGIHPCARYHWESISASLSPLP